MGSFVLSLSWGGGGGGGGGGETKVLVTIPRLCLVLAGYTVG